MRLKRLSAASPRGFMLSALLAVVLVHVVIKMQLFCGNGGIF